MRNISFSLTTEQFNDRTKTVTRRLGWKFLKVGEVLMACEKCMGLKSGEKIVRLGRIRVVSSSQEELRMMAFNKDYGLMEAAREGFPNLSGAEFVQMFCKHMKCKQTTTITRIEFEYLENEKAKSQGE